MAPKKPSVKGTDKPPGLVVEPPLPDPFYQKHPDAKPTFDEQWFDDPVDGEEAIRLAVALHKKIEEKAVPIRTWLERNIVPLLLQALTALVAKRPSNPCEFMAAHLLKYNPLKDKYPEDEPKPPKILEEVCEESDEDDEDDPCGCKRFLKKECADEKAATAAAAATAAEEKKAKETAADVKQLAKRSTIAADARKSVTAPDAARESMVKALSKKKSIK